MGFGVGFYKVSYKTKSKEIPNLLFKFWMNKLTDVSR